MKIIKIILYFLLAILFILIISISVILLMDNSNTSYLDIQNYESKDDSAILIRNINLIPMSQDTVIANSSILVRNGRIEQIGEYIEGGSVYEIDGENKYLSPGLIDMHVHVWDKYELGLYLANGVTAVRNLWGIPLHLRIKKELQNDNIIGPMFFTSSPKLTGPEDFGDDKVQLQSVEEAKKLVQSYHRRGYDFIKTYAGITEPLFDAIVDESIAINMDIVSHPSFQMTYSKNFIPEVATIEHAEDIVQQALHYQLDTVKLDSVIQLMAATKVSFSPTMSGFYKIYEMLTHEDILGSEGLHYINPLFRSVDSESQVARWQNEKAQNPDVIQNILGQHKFHLYIIKKLHEAGVNIVSSTDAGIAVSPAGFTLHEELQLYKEAGLSNFEVLQTSTVNPSRVHEVFKDMGTIEKGNWANLILSDENPLENLETLKHPQWVLIKGRLLNRNTLEIFKAKAYDRKNKAASALFWLENLWVER